MARLFTEQFAFSKGDSVVVIGLGRFGGAVANSLMQLGHDVMGIDRDPEPVHEWADLLTHAVQADATSAMTSNSPIRPECHWLQSWRSDRPAMSSAGPSQANRSGWRRHS